MYIYIYIYLFFYIYLELNLFYLLLFFYCIYFLLFSLPWHSIQNSFHFMHVFWPRKHQGEMRASVLMNAGVTETHREQMKHHMTWLTDAQYRLGFTWNVAWIVWMRPLCRSAVRWYWWGSETCPSAPPSPSSAVRTDGRTPASWSLKSFLWTSDHITFLYLSLCERVLPLERNDMWSSLYCKNNQHFNNKRLYKWWNLLK